jgi:hypothetical protein
LKIKGTLNIRGYSSELIFECFLDIDKHSLIVAADFDMSLEQIGLEIPEKYKNMINNELNIYLKCRLEPVK